jgi:hypothetical protein
LSHQTEADPISLLRPLLAALIEMKEDFLSALVAINKAKQSLGNYLATVPNSFPSFITAIRCHTCALHYHALRGLHRAIALSGSLRRPDLERSPRDTVAAKRPVVRS